MDIYSIVVVCLCSFVLFIAFLAVFVDNKNIDYEPYTVGDGARRIRVAHLSDLHFPKQAVNTLRFLEELRSLGIDFVAITGDLMGRHSDIFTCGALEFARALSAEYPVDYVRGNHETEHKRGEIFTEELKKLGVRIVENRAELFKKDDVKIAVAGAGSRAAFHSEQVPDAWNADFTLLLAHHPEKRRWKGYAGGGGKAPDLTLAGHAHGGQFRIFGMGVYAPDQGLFPRVTYGRYKIGENAELIVSRGIGKSEFPIRLNNPPHVPVIDIFV